MPRITEESKCGLGLHSRPYRDTRLPAGEPDNFLSTGNRENKRGTIHQGTRKETQARMPASTTLVEMGVLARLAAWGQRERARGTQEGWELPLSSVLPMPGLGVSNSQKQVAM